MASYNRIILVGNLTRDPEIRYVDGGGKAVTKFSLAVNRRTKQGDETMFLDVVAWEQLGERCNQYLRKGAAALVEGRLTIRNYDDKDGNKRKAVEVVASDVQFLSAKGGSTSPAAAAPADEGEVEDEVPF